MEYDEVVILASDSDSDEYEYNELFSTYTSLTRPTTTSTTSTCTRTNSSPAVTSFICKADSTRDCGRKSVTISTTGSKLCPFTSKEQRLGQVICERNVVPVCQTQNKNGQHYFSRNSISTISKADILSSSQTGQRGCQNGHSCKNDGLCNLNKEDIPLENAQNDVFLSYKGRPTSTGKGICKTEKEKNWSKNESSCRIMNNLTMTSEEKFEEIGLESSASTSIFGTVDEKCASSTGVSAERNTFDELFEDDIHMAVALSLQPHYMPNLEPKSCDEDDSVEKIGASGARAIINENMMQTNIDKLENNVYKTGTSEGKSYFFEKIKKRKRSKQLNQTTKCRKICHKHSQEFNSKDYEKKKKFGTTIKPIRIYLVDESEDDFSDDLPDIDDVQIVNTPIKKEFKTDLVKSVCTIPSDYDSLDDFEIPAKQIKLSQDESKSTKKDSTLSKSNLLFTSEHKNKLARLLSAVSYKSAPKKTKMIVSDGENNDSSESSRHWMDCLDSLNQTRKLPNESDYQSDTSLESITILASSQSSSDNDAGSTTSLMQLPLRSVEYCQSDDSQESVASEEQSVPDSLLPIYTKSKVSDTQDWIDQNVNQCAQSEDNVKLTADGTRITSVLSLRNVRMEPTDPINNAIVTNQSYTNQYYTSIINNVKLSSASVVNNLVESFSAMHIYSLEAAMEEGDAFFDCSLEILKGFVVQNKPTVKVLDDILFKGLLGKYSAYICVKCYNILRFVWQTYPDLIQIDWDILCDKIGGVTYQSNSSSTTNLQSGLLLHLYVFGFEINIFQNSIRNKSKLMRTFTYRLLSEDCAFSNLKLIITWIEFCINSSSHEGITEAFLQGGARIMPAELTEKHLINFDAPYKLLPDLNRLIELGIDISRNCLDASKRIASELEKTYIYATDIKQKKILIHLVCSDLLRLNLIQRVMEDYCEGIVPTPTNFPLSFTRLKDSYFNARPPRSPLCTPPQSPNNGELYELGYVVSYYTPESVEELSLLVYYAAKSYLNCIKRCLHDPLHLRYCQKNLDDVDKSALETLPERAMEFYRHLQRLNPELTPAAQQNCIMLTCLSETFL